MVCELSSDVVDSSGRICRNKRNLDVIIGAIIVDSIEKINQEKLVKLILEKKMEKVVENN